jgi:hypothetical protein
LQVLALYLYLEADDVAKTLSYAAV